jgi:glycosyltransferase involved in cell wall biosynthesis
VQPIAICAIYKNESPYLLEWIAFHKSIGVDHFILYDNGSDDDGTELIQSSAFADMVTIVDWPQRPGQFAAYADCIARYADRFSWIAFIDVDEFIHPLESNSLRELLQHPRYAAFSEVLIFWLLFGSGGNRTRPEGLVLENYRKRVPEDSPVNGHVKTIARGSALLGAGTTPHILQTTGRTCDATGETIVKHALHERACHEVMVLNHYFTKSLEEWEAKLRRGKADEAVATNNAYPASRIQDVDNQIQVEDSRIVRFVPRMRWLLR